MVIHLIEVAARAFRNDERPIHRQVWYLLRMQHWRNQRQIAQETRDYETLDKLDREWETINSL